MRSQQMLLLSEARIVPKKKVDPAAHKTGVGQHDQSKSRAGKVSGNLVKCCPDEQHSQKGLTVGCSAMPSGGGETNGMHGPGPVFQPAEET